MITKPLNIPPELKKCMERDAAVLLYENAIPGILFTLLTATFLVFAFNVPQTESFKNSWWGVMAVLLALRIINIIWWKKKLKQTEFDGKKAVKHFILGANPVAIMWAIYFVYMANSNNDLELIATIITIAGLAGGTTIVLAAHKYTSMFYGIILLAPGSLGLLLLSDKELFQLLGWLGIAFSVMMFIISKKSAEFTFHTLFLKNENSVLIHQMEEKVKQRTQEIYELSNLDPLTGLFNRTAFLAHLKSVISTSNQKFALLFIDLDDFKKINDSIGHKAGDQVLKETAKRLQKSNLNAKLLCRWGGDEFLIVLENIEEADAVKKSLKLIELLTLPHHFDNSVLSVGATIGIALYPQHATTEDGLIQSADMAMYYQKKQACSSAVVFSEHMQKIYSYELHLKDGLTSAIEKQQLRLVFQPLVLAKNNKTVAFEALLRWQFGDESIPPDEFIGIAEQYGLIHEIGAWVLDNACQQASQWSKELQLAICVNVSVIQLKNEHFINIVDNALLQSHLPADLLHIEITESVFSSDINIILNQIKQLQARGIKVSIDDFGTGYSSLSIMQDLAVNIVKIDRSFINNLNGNGHAIISAVMNIAPSLGFLVVAEGVETKEQAQELSKLGVHFLQGYYFSKPIEIEDIDTFLGENVNDDCNSNACPTLNSQDFTQIRENLNQH